MNEDFKALVEELYPTQAAFAEDAGISKVWASRLMNGHAGPSKLMMQYLRRKKQVVRLEAVILDGIMTRDD